MLAGAGFGDDARLAHAAGQKDLAHGVVDFVRAGVKQVFAFEINFWPAQFPRQPFRKIKRRGPAAKLAQIISQFLLKFRVVLRPKIFLLQLLERVHQRFRHITSAIRAEIAPGHRAAWFQRLRSQVYCHLQPRAWQGSASRPIPGAGSNRVKWSLTMPVACMCA